MNENQHNKEEETKLTTTQHFLISCITYLIYILVFSYILMISWNAFAPKLYLDEFEFGNALGLFGFFHVLAAIFHHNKNLKQGK